MAQNNEIIEVVGIVDYRFDDDPAAEEATLALCSVVIGGHFTCKNIRVVRTKDKGIRVRFPTLSLPDEDGQMQNIKIFQPATQRANSALIKAVMDAYNAKE